MPWPLPTFPISATTSSPPVLSLSHQPCLECPSSRTMNGSLLPVLRSLLPYPFFQGVFSGHVAYSFSMSLSCFIFPQSMIILRIQIYFWVYRFIVSLPHLLHVSSWDQESGLFLPSPESLATERIKQMMYPFVTFLGKYMYKNYPNASKI